MPRIPLVRGAVENTRSSGQALLSVASNAVTHVGRKVDVTKGEESPPQYLGQALNDVINHSNCHCRAPYDENRT